MPGPWCVLAHQGGWDEMLMVAAPVAIFVALLRAATIRSAKLSDRTVDPDPGADDEAQTSDDPTD